jgi:hypothetical protein
MATKKIKPLVDIVWEGQVHKADSEPFEVPSDIAKRLIDNGNAKEAKNK